MTGDYITGRKVVLCYTRNLRGTMASDWKTVSATWEGDLSFIGESDDGGTVQMSSFGGESGIGPMKLILAGLAGCTGIDIVSILKKKKLYQN